MAILAQQIENYNKNNIGTYKQETAYWKDLTERLNNLGPPYRTLQQWKKVCITINKYLMLLNKFITITYFAFFFKGLVRF